MFTTLKSVSAVGLFLIAASFTNSAHAQIAWKNSPQKAVQAAQSSGKPILVFVTTDWCHYCQKMKRETWANPQLAAAIPNHFETLVIDGDKDKQLVQQFEIRGFPATLVFSADGKLLAKKGGFMAPAAADAWLVKALRNK